MTSSVSDQPVATLQRAQRLVEPVLRNAVRHLPALMGRPIGYQFGWYDEHGVPVRAAGGKGVRPALVLLSAEAVGGTAESAVRAAAAVELIHNFSVVHDDIMDGDAVRRHRPTVWASFGVPVATLAGDALLALAIDVVVSSATAGALPASRVLAQALLGLVEGQSLDVEFESRAHVHQDEYLKMATGKTAALFGCACALGAAFGGAEPALVQHLHQFGRHLGLAFQMTDDLLGIWGDPLVTGKSARSDLRSRKKSFPVVLALSSESPAGREFSRLYHRGEPLDEQDLDTAAALIDQAGGRAGAQAAARRHLAEALRCLRAADPVPTAADELTALARSMAERDH